MDQSDGWRPTVVMWACHMGPLGHGCIVTPCCCRTGSYREKVHASGLPWLLPAINICPFRECTLTTPTPAGKKIAQQKQRNINKRIHDLHLGSSSRSLRAEEINLICRISNESTWNNTFTGFKWYLD